MCHQNGRHTDLDSHTPAPEAQLIEAAARSPTCLPVRRVQNHLVGTDADADAGEGATLRRLARGVPHAGDSRAEQSIEASPCRLTGVLRFGSDIRPLAQG